MDDAESDSMRSAGMESGGATSPDCADPPSAIARAWRPADLRPFADACAQALAAVDFADLPASVAKLLTTLCNVRSLLITRYERGASPKTLFHTVGDDDVAATITMYERGPYKLDPFFLACVVDGRSGVFRLSEIAPDNFTRTSYYLDFYRRLRMGEEVGLIIPTGDGIGIVISLESGNADARFRDIELQWLAAAFPIVHAAVSRQWAQGNRENVGDRQPSINDLFEGFGRGVLSNRECEVVRLILQGHSSASIAVQLGIATGTVKMHRKHAYQKLAVSSQAQLFQRFMASVGAE
jgi:DNA-binding CsgD family transcriptional regulator